MRIPLLCCLFLCLLFIFLWPANHVTSEKKIIYSLDQFNVAMQNIKQKSRQQQPHVTFDPSKPSDKSDSPNKDKHKK